MNQLDPSSSPSAQRPVRRALLTLLGCCGLVGCAATNPEAPVFAEGEVHLTIDLDAPQHTTGRLIGWNIGSGTRYAPEGDPRHPEWRLDAVVEAVGLLGQVRAAEGPAPLLRFSGQQIDGSLGGDGYHFWRYVDPDGPVASTDNLSSHHLLALVEDAGGEPTITVNFGSGTAAEAADYARHLNGDDPGDPLVAARQLLGREEPWDQRLFEIGNEVYAFWNTGYSGSGNYSYGNPEALHGGDPDWWGRPSSDAANYGARALSYVEAITAVTPEARFYIPITQADFAGWGGLADSLPILRELLSHPSVQAGVVHHYSVDDAAGAGLNDGNDIEFLLSSAEHYRPYYQQLRELMDQLPREEPLQLAITEYHAAALGVMGFDSGDEAIVGLALADQLILFAQLGVEVAMQHMTLDFLTGGGALSQTWHIPFREAADGVQTMPSFEVTRLLADHLLSRTVAATEAVMPRADYDLAGGGYSFARVHQVAFVDEAGDRGTLWLLHREVGGARTLTVDLPVGATATGLSRFAPPWAGQNALADPVPITEGSWEQRGQRVQLELPPHSLSVLRFDL